MRVVTSTFLSATLAILLVFGLVISFSFHPPVEEGKLKVSGRVKNSKNKALDSSMVIITDSAGTKALDTVIADKKGKFSFDLDYNKYYRTYYAKEGYVYMFNEYDTKVPDNKLYKDLYYNAAVSLLEDSADFNKRTAARKPFMKVAFDPAYDMFVENLEDAMAFLDEVIKPNVGEMVIAGVFRDTLIDSFNVKVLAQDTLGFLLAETTSDENGNYKVVVPLMSKVKLKFISEDHYESFAMVNSAVPEGEQFDDFAITQDFSLVNKEDTTVNEEAFDKPIARIEHLGETGSFVENPMVAEIFEDELLGDKRRMTLKGLLTTNSATPITNSIIKVMDGEVVIEETVTDTSTFEAKLPYGTIVHVYIKANNFHETFISYNTNLNNEEMRQNKEVSNSVELYSREDQDVNPMAFQFPAAKYFYNDYTEGFERDTNVSNDFMAILNQPINQSDTAVSHGLLTLNGLVIDPGRGNKKVPNARIRILDDNRKLISAFGADKKGRFSIKIGLDKVYFLEVEKEEFLATQVKFDTKVPEGMADTNILQYGLRLPIIHPENIIEGKKVRQELLNQQEISAYAYDSTINEFVEDPAVFDAFAAAVRDYVEPEKEAPAVTAEMLAANKKKELKKPKVNVAGKVLDEANVPVEGATIALVEGRKTLHKTETDSLGNYNLKLPIQKDMKMEVTGKNLHKTTVAVSTVYPDTLEPKDDIIVLPNLTAYNKANVGVNEEAFENDWQKIAYNPVSNRFETDPEAPKMFASALRKIEGNQKLLVEGRAKDQKGRSISDAKVLIRENGVVVNTIITDKKGKYTAELDYQKDYRVEVLKDGYNSTFASISTKTNNAEDRLIDKQVKSFNLLLVSKDENNVNNKVFYQPYARVAYDAKKGEFVEVNDVTSNFLADLYIEEIKDKKGKKQYQLKTKKVAAKFEKSNTKGYKEYVSRAGASAEAAKKRTQNKSAAGKANSMFMGDFHNAMAGIQTNRRTKIKNVTLSMNEIYNARLALAEKTKMEADENLAEASEQRELMSEIIAQALGMRRDADLVSTDSTLNVMLRPRIRHLEEGVPTYKISRDQVFVEGKKIDYVETTDWFLWKTQYKNNKRISASTYEAELDSIRSIGFNIN